MSIYPEFDDEGFVNDEEIGDLDINSFIDQNGWLIKLPDFLYQKWAKLESPNKTLGRIEVYHDANGVFPPTYKLVLEDDDTNLDVPKQYDIETLTGTTDSTYFFDCDVENEAVQIAGTVSENRFLRPAFNEDYRRNLRQRTLQASQPKRPIKMIESNENRGGYVPPGSSAAAVAKFGNLVRKKQKVTNEQKTTRMPDEQLVNMLFHAFEQYKYWTFKGLKDYVKQPESFLKDKLNEIAVLDKRGPYNNCYHLKSEYTRKLSQTSEEIAPVGLEAPGSSGDTAGGDDDNDIEDDVELLENDDDGVMIEPLDSEEGDLFGED